MRDILSLYDVTFRMTVQEMPEDVYCSLKMSEQLLKARECYVPPELPIDLRSKLTISLIMSEAFTLAQPLVEALMRSGMCYL